MYAPTIHKHTEPSLFTTGIFGVVKTVVTFIWLLWLIDHVGRRNLLLIGAAGGSVCLWIVGAYIKIAQPESRGFQCLGMLTEFRTHGVPFQVGV
jgi:hypothetical protein